MVRLGSSAAAHRLSGRAFVLRAGSSTKADSAVARYRVASGATRAVTLRLSAALRKRIRRDGPQRRGLSISALDADGKAIRVVTRPLRLRAG